MLSQVTWSDYFRTLFIILIVYYAIIIIVYFRRDIVSIALNRKSRMLGPAVSAVNTSGSDEVLADAEYNQVKNLIQDIDGIFEKGYIKEELIHALQLKVKEYKNIQGTAYQVAVMNHILKTAQEKSSILVSESEMRVIWNEA